MVVKVTNTYAFFFQITFFLNLILIAEHVKYGLEHHSYFRLFQIAKIFILGYGGNPYGGRGGHDPYPPPPPPSYVRERDNYGNGPPGGYGVVVTIARIAAIIPDQEHIVEAQVLMEEVVETTEVKEAIMVQGATITQVGATVQAQVDMVPMVAEMGEETIMAQILV